MDNAKDMGKAAGVSNSQMSNIFNEADKNLKAETGMTMKGV